MPRKHYKVSEDLIPYLHPLTPWNKQAVLPNLTLLTDPLEALRRINWAKANIDYYNAGVKIPGETFSTYCKLFTCSTPGGGGWDGSGVIMTNDYPNPTVYTFALCLHEKSEEGHSPNHNRGWHPGHCAHCNMDMSVDSGD